MKGADNMPKTWLELLALDQMAAALLGLQISDDALCWKRFCGSLALVLVVLLFLSGAFMAFYYSPYPGAAYDSVGYAQYELPFGDVVRGIHHWSWNLLLVTMLLHLSRAVWVGAYKAPRQMVWGSGVLLLLFLPVFIITGDLLPWTQAGYWTTQVRTSILSSIPGAGPFIVNLLQGGPRTGIMALTRFYTLHVIFLPYLLLLLLSFHFYFLACRGVSGPLSDAAAPVSKVPFLPVMLNRWLVLFISVALTIGLAARFWLPAPFGDPADPTDSTFVPRPEWWVLFLNKLVGIFSGPLTVVGAVIVPGALAGLLLALPVLDRSAELRPLRRWKTMLAAAMLAAAILVLSWLSFLEHYAAPPH